MTITRATEHDEVLCQNSVCSVIICAYTAERWTKQCGPLHRCRPSNPPQTNHSGHRPQSGIAGAAR